MILEGADTRDRTQLRISQAVAWATAQLVTIGFNKPDKFPRFEKAFPDPEAKRTPQSPDEIWQAMERWVAVSDLRDGQTQKGPP